MEDCSHCAQLLNVFWDLWKGCHISGTPQQSIFLEFDISSMMKMMPVLLPPFLHILEEDCVLLLWSYDTSADALEDSLTPCCSICRILSYTSLFLMMSTNITRRVKEMLHSSEIDIYQTLFTYFYFHKLTFIYRYQKTLQMS